MYVERINLINIYGLQCDNFCVFVECRPQEMFDLRKRLTGWFVLLHTESRQMHHRQSRNKFDDFHHKKGHKKSHHKGNKFDKHQADPKIDQMKIESRSKRSIVTVPNIETETRKWYTRYLCFYISCMENFKHVTTYRQ